MEQQCMGKLLIKILDSGAPRAASIIQKLILKSLEYNFTPKILLDSLVIKPQGGSCLSLIRTRITVYITVPGFLCACWGSNSDPWTCVARTFQPQPSPQLHNQDFIVQDLTHDLYLKKKCNESDIIPKLLMPLDTNFVLPITCFSFMVSHFLKTNPDLPFPAQVVVITQCRP